MVYIFIFIDFFIKLFILNNFDIFYSNGFLYNKFFLNLVFNSGFIFGLVSLHLYLYQIVYIILCVIIFLNLFIYIKDINIFGFYYIFCGVLGNIFDRVLYGCVIDFVDIYIDTIHMYVFNLSDVLIFLGLILL